MWFFAVVTSRSMQWAYLPPPPPPTRPERVNKMKRIYIERKLEPSEPSLYALLPSAYYRVVCPNFGIPVLTSELQVYALCRCCRHNTRKKNHHLKAKTLSKLTAQYQMFLNYFSRSKMYLSIKILILHGKHNYAKNCEFKVCFEIVLAFE